jgi:hypothetical protein
MIESAMGIYKIRYHVLGDIMDLSSIKYSKYKNVNFYIDMNKMLEFMTKDSYKPTLESGTQNQPMFIVNSILGLVTHYRKFISGSGKTTNFYIIFNDENSEYKTSIIEGYRNEHYSIFKSKDLKNVVTNHIIKKACKILETICPNLLNIHFINESGIEFEDVCRYLIDEHSDNKDYNIVFTKDIVSFQLVSDDTCILRPKRDMSYILDSTNFWDSLCNNDLNIKYKPKDLPYDAYVYYLAIKGIKNRQIPAIITGNVRILRLMDELYSLNILQSGVVSRMFADEFYQRCSLTSDTEVFLNNHRVLTNNKNRPMSSQAKNRISTTLSFNYYRFNELEEFNEYLHSDYKLDIYTLCEGKYKTTKKRLWE